MLFLPTNFTLAWKLSIWTRCSAHSWYVHPCTRHQCWSQFDRDLDHVSSDDVTGATVFHKHVLFLSEMCKQAKAFKALLSVKTWGVDFNQIYITITAILDLSTSKSFNLPVLRATLIQSMNSVSLRIKSSPSWKSTILVIKFYSHCWVFDTSNLI